MSGFNGSSTESAGRFKVPLILRNNHHFLHDFYVVPNITDECILGLDFMHKYGVKFDGKTGSISYDSNGKTHNLINVIAIKNQQVAESLSEISPLPNLSHLTNNQQKSVSSLLSHYTILYGSTLGDLNSNLPVKHRILLTDRNTSIFIPHYRTPFHQRSLLQEHINNLLKGGIMSLRFTLFIGGEKGQ